MAMREHDMELNEMLIPHKVCNGVEDFFEKDQDLYQSITIEFIEYMVDLSIN